MTTPDGWSETVVGEVRRLWGDQLRPVDHGRVYRGLSTRTREFLTIVGLPMYESNMGVAILPDMLNQPVSRNGREYIPVAAVAGMGLVYAIEVKSDRVYFIGPLKSRCTPEFLNTDVGLFLLFLGVCEKDIIDAAGAMDAGADEAYEIMGRARGLLTSMDPEAMREDGSWASQVNDFETDIETAFPEAI